MEIFDAGKKLAEDFTVIDVDENHQFIKLFPVPNKSRESDGVFEGLEKEILCFVRGEI